MAMTVQDFHDLVRLLEAHPQWRTELRHLLLTDELLALPDIVRELVAAQRRTEERVGELAAAQRRTEERVEELAAAQRRTEERVATLATRVEELVGAQRRTEERVEELVAAQRRTEERFEQLATATRELVARAGKLTDDVGMLKGYVLERKYRERAPSYFAPLLRGIHALSSEEVARLVDEAVSRGVLSGKDRDEIMETDLVIRGVRPADSSETYLAVEISAGIGRHDVTCAQDRARILQRLLSKPVLPVVAGEWITSDAEEQAIATQVWRVLNGRTQAPGGDGTAE
jgi:hypothetical protein